MKLNKETVFHCLTCKCQCATNLIIHYYPFLLPAKIRQFPFTDVCKIYCNCYTAITAKSKHLLDLRHLRISFCDEWKSIFSFSTKEHLDAIVQFRRNVCVMLKQWDNSLLLLLQLIHCPLETAGSVNQKVLFIKPTCADACIV